MLLGGLVMPLTNLGKYIEVLDKRNKDNIYTAEDVVGLSTQKTMIQTKADLEGVSLLSYKLMPPNSFAYVPDTSRRGNKMSLAFNSTQDVHLVSSISIVFIVNQPSMLSSEYLFMYFNRPEFDRYARFNSWGSARETFSWNDMCDIEIELPSLEIQQKYVDIYNAMLQNQKTYEMGVEDLKLVCDGYIEKLRKNMPTESIGEYIEEYSDKNTELLYFEKDIRGISIDKRFIPTKANTTSISLNS